MARRSIVLLTNDGTLPLVQGDALMPGTETTRKAVLVVGPNADDQHAQLGDWAGASGQVNWMKDGHPRHLTSTVLDGIRATAPVGWTVGHARGADIGSLAPDPEGEMFRDGQPRPPLFVSAAPNPSLISEAVAAAQGCDYVVAVLGDEIGLTGEGRSTATLELQGGQVALLDALVDTGTPVIVVLVQSKPSTLPASAMRAAAIIEAFNPGMQGGRAVAEIVFGLVEPSGRLPISFARHAGQLPVYYNQLRGQHGNRYADLTQASLFAFGEGLSYSTVIYSKLRLKQAVVSVNDVIHATVTLTNSGKRSALETIQAYIADEVTTVTWAEKELKSFAQVTIQPGEQVDVDIVVEAEQCSIVDSTGRRIVEPGQFELLVGPSSREKDLLRATFRIE